jgi:hypothetical protein
MHGQLYKLPKDICVESPHASKDLPTPEHPVHGTLVLTG